jgi:hypothetical protein
VLQQRHLRDCSLCKGGGLGQGLQGQDCLLPRALFIRDDDSLPRCAHLTGYEGVRSAGFSCRFSANSAESVSEQSPCDGGITCVTGSPGRTD